MRSYLALPLKALEMRPGPAGLVYFGRVHGQGAGENPDQGGLWRLGKGCKHRTNRGRIKDLQKTQKRESGQSGWCYVEGRNQRGEGFLMLGRGARSSRDRDPHWIWCAFPPRFELASGSWWAQNGRSATVLLSAISPPSKPVYTDSAAKWGGEISSTYQKNIVEREATPGARLGPSNAQAKPILLRCVRRNQLQILGFVPRLCQRQVSWPLVSRNPTVSRRIFPG